MTRPAWVSDELPVPRSGQATDHVDPIEAVESLLGSLYLRLLVTGAPIASDDLRRLADRTTRMLRRE